MKFLKSVMGYKRPDVMRNAQVRDRLNISSGNGRKSTGQTPKESACPYIWKSADYRD